MATHIFFGQAYADLRVSIIDALRWSKLKVEGASAEQPDREAAAFRRSAAKEKE